MLVTTKKIRNPIKNAGIGFMALIMLGVGGFAVGVEYYTIDHPAHQIASIKTTPSAHTTTSSTIAHLSTVISKVHTTPKVVPKKKSKPSLSPTNTLYKKLGIQKVYWNEVTKALAQDGVMSEFLHGDYHYNLSSFVAGNVYVPYHELKAGNADIFLAPNGVFSSDVAYARYLASHYSSESVSVGYALTILQMGGNG